jgi:F0F1-type ATP synthase membrane subunit c/vacuolar-type H+-ATPase subunit K
MTDLETAIENLKFEYSLSDGQRIAKTILVAFAGLAASAAAGNVFNASVKAIRNSKTTV